MKIPIGFNVVKLGSKDNANSTITILRTELNGLFEHKNGIPITTEQMMERMQIIKKDATESSVMKTYIPRYVKVGAVMLLEKDGKRFVMSVRLITPQDHILKK